jgi:predicted CXXCH cytochrome family protein
MTRSRFEKIAFTGLGALLASAIVLGVTHVAVAQAPADATYKGMNLCVLCHKVKHPVIAEAFPKTAHPKALRTPDEEGAIVAKFDEDSPVSKADIAYILGVGKRKQAYIGKDGKTLPGQWDVKNSKWIRQEVVDGMTQCVPCHVTGMDMKTKAWNEKGITCESCHGAGSAHATTGDKTKINNPKTLTPERSAMLCGQCHARGTTLDGTMPRSMTYKFGDDLSKHIKLAEVKGPAANQQYNEWLGSKHATSGVTCTGCHDIHGPGSANPGQLKKAEKELCSGCHAADLAKPEHPKLTDAMKCGLCHMPQGTHTFKMPGQ